MISHSLTLNSGLFLLSPLASLLFTICLKIDDHLAIYFFLWHHRKMTTRCIFEMNGCCCDCRLKVSFEHLFSYLWERKLYMTWHTIIPEDLHTYLIIIDILIYYDNLSSCWLSIRFWIRQLEEIIFPSWQLVRADTCMLSFFPLGYYFNEIIFVSGCGFPVWIGDCLLPFQHLSVVSTK